MQCKTTVTLPCLILELLPFVNLTLYCECFTECLCYSSTKWPSTKIIMPLTNTTQSSQKPSTQNVSASTSSPQQKTDRGQLV